MQELPVGCECVSFLSESASCIPRSHFFCACRAQLYLVVVTQNDKGLKEGNYFMCDRDETVENAMAGMDEKAEFVILLLEDL